MDHREEILNESFSNHGLEDAYREITTKPFRAVLDAMDEHGKQISISFLKYALEKMGGHSVDAAGNVEIKYKGEWITAEQLFENFL